MNLGFNMKGSYTLRILRKGRVVTERSFDNIITNGGLERLMNGAGAALTTCYVGTGTSAPAVGNTTLATPLASTSTSVGATSANAGTAPYKNTYTKLFEFPLGAVVGNVTEIGVGWGSGLFSRALVLDGGGSPTALTVTATDILQVTYKIEQTPSVTSTTGSFLLNGASLGYTARIINVTQNAFSSMATNGYMNSNFTAGVYETGTLAAITDFSPTGAVAGASAATVAYTSGTYERSATISVALANGNFAGGIGSMVVIVGGGWTYHIVFASPIMKTASQTLSLGVKYSISQG